MVNDIAEKYKVSVDKVFVDFVGINHLLWGQKVTVNGKDVTAELVEDASRDTEQEIMANIPDVKVASAFMGSSTFPSEVERGMRLNV